MKATLNALKASITVFFCLSVLLLPASTNATGGTQVSGGGTAVITDDTGRTYSLQFGLSGVVQSDGSASGHVNFVFPKPFSADWGAVPGVERITIAGRVTSGEIAPDGTVIIEGTLTERDYTSGQGIVFLEENVPFRIEIGGSLGAGTMNLQWCLLPIFGVAVTDGNLSIN